MTTGRYYHNQYLHCLNSCVMNALHDVKGDISHRFRRFASSSIKGCHTMFRFRISPKERLASSKFVEENVLFVPE